MVGVVALVKAATGRARTFASASPTWARRRCGPPRSRRRCGAAARRRRHRGGGRAGRRGHRAPRRPERHARVQAPPGPRADAAGADAAAVVMTFEGARIARSAGGPGGAALPGRPRRWPPSVLPGRRARAAAAAGGRGRAWARPRWRKALARRDRARALIRLQCHEGIDLHHALYDWDYPRQLLASGRPRAATDAGSTRERFLLRRPLLEALEHDGPVVLLIDEVDRADDEFEAFLLELLSDFQVSIPELGTVDRQAAAAGGAHLQPHARAARRAQAALPVPLDRLPGRPSARPRSCARGCPAWRTRWPSACARRWRGCAGRSCTSCRASARRSRGRRRCWRWRTLAGGHAWRRAQGARGHRARCAREGVLRVSERLGAGRRRPGSSACRRRPCAPEARGSGSTSSSAPIGRCAPSMPPTGEALPRAAGGAVLPPGGPRRVRRRLRRGVRRPAPEQPEQPELLDDVAALVLPARGRAAPARSRRRPSRWRRDVVPAAWSRRRAAARQGLRRVHRGRAASSRAGHGSRLARRGPRRASRRTRPSHRRGAAPARRSPRPPRAPCAHRCARAASRSSGTGASRASARGRSCWSATSRARWSPTRGCCSSTCRPAWRRAGGSRRSCSAPASRASRASWRAATPIARWSARRGAPEDWSGGTRIGDALADPQPRARPPDRPRRGGGRPLRRLGSRRPRAAGAEMARLVTLRPPAGVAQPAQGAPRLRAADARDAGGPAPRGRLPGREHARFARAARR